MPHPACPKSLLAQKALGSVSWVMWLECGHRGRLLATIAASRTEEAATSRRKKDPLRELTADERRALARLSRSQAAPAVGVALSVAAEMILLTVIVAVTIVLERRAEPGQARKVFPSGPPDTVEA